MNLRTVRAYLLKEDFQRFWNYTYPAWAEKFLQRWCSRTMRSNIEPMKDIAKMLRRHQELILNWFRAKKRSTRHCRGPEPEMESDGEKSIRIPRHSKAL